MSNNSWVTIYLGLGELGGGNFDVFGVEVIICLDCPEDKLVQEFFLGLRQRLDPEAWMANVLPLIDSKAKSYPEVGLKPQLKQ